MKLELDSFFDLDGCWYKEIFNGDILETLKRSEKFIDDFLKHNVYLECNELDGYSGVYVEGKVHLHRKTKILPGTYIRGPAILGDCVIGPNAIIRDYTIIGDDCEIGWSEVKHSILFRGVAAKHSNYIGDSIIGNNANLGAGVKIANYRLDRKNIFVDGRDFGRKFGAIIGDNVSIGCNSVTNPGTVIEKNLKFYPNSLLSGLYPYEIYR